MSRRKRSSPQGADRVERWLGPDATPRSRRWAYEELLLGPGDDAERAGLRSEAADLASDLAELKRLQNELHDHVVRVAALEGQVRAHLRSSEPSPPRTGSARADDAGARVEIRSFPSDPIRTRAARGRGSSLARCEGFRVDSPTGFVGFVEGLRFVTRIDEPDFLEVGGGRFGREVALIPIEAVEEISLGEERLFVRGAPNVHGRQGHELVNRLLSALHHLF